MIHPSEFYFDSTESAQPSFALRLRSWLVTHARGDSMPSYDWSACLTAFCTVNVPSPTVNNTYTYVDIDITCPRTSLILTVLDIDQGYNGGINECVLPSRNNAEEVVGEMVSSNVPGTFCALSAGHSNDNPKGIPWTEEDDQRALQIPIYSQIRVRFLTYCCIGDHVDFVPQSSGWLDTMTYVDDASQFNGGRNFFLAFGVVPSPVRPPPHLPFPPSGPPVPYHPPRPPMESILRAPLAPNTLSPPSFPPRPPT